MKKFTALFLVAVMLIMTVATIIPVASAEADAKPIYFNSAEAVALWKIKTGNSKDTMPSLASSYFAAGEGQNGRGALKFDASAMGADKVTAFELAFGNCIDIKAGQTAIVKIVAKGNRATAKSGERVAFRLSTDNGYTIDKPENRLYIEQNGDGTYQESVIEVTPAADVKGINLVTLTVKAGLVLYIDSIEVIDKATGESLVSDDVIENDNDPFAFDTAKAVAKWTKGANALDASYFEKAAGNDGTGAIKLTGLTGVVVLKLKNSVSIPTGSNVTISFETKSSVALEEGLKGGNKRVLIRLEGNDNTRTSKANPGDGSWVTTSVRYVGTEPGGRDNKKQNVDKDYTTIEIVTFNLAATDVVYIDNIKITDDNGKSYLVSTMLDIPRYTVTWNNHDGTALETDTVKRGDMPIYNAAAPTKAATAEKTYTFKGWDKEVSAVSGDVTYTAVFTETVNTYTVTWKNEDGTVLETDTGVAYGTTPTYDAAAPAKASTDKQTFTFKGWDKEVSAVTGDVTYIAVFEAVDIPVNPGTFDSMGMAFAVVISFSAVTALAVSSKKKQR